MKFLRYYIVLCTFLFVICGSASAQSFTNAESRKINTMLLDVIDRYEDFAGVYDEDSEYEFLRLFQSPDSPVYAGDLLLGYGVDETIPASEYATKMLDFTPNVAVTISKVRKGQAYYENDVLYIPVSLQKSIEYTDGNLILSSDIFYDDKFDLTLLMACDLENEKCKIASITGSIDSEDVFPMNFYLIRRPEPTSSNLKLEDMLTVDGKKLEYNIFDYAIVPEGKLDPMSFKEVKHEVRISSELVDSTFRHKEMSYDFKKTRGRFKIRNKYAPMSAYALTKAPSGVSADSWAYELGFDLGFGVPVGVTGASRFGLFIGLAASYSDLTLNNEGFNYIYSLDEYHTSPSKPGRFDLASRTDYFFDISSVRENVTFIDLMVPLYMSFDHRFGKKGRVWLNWNFGVKAYVNMNDIIGWNMSSYIPEGRLTVTDAIRQIRLYEGSFNKNINEFISAPKYTKELYELSAAANAALYIKLSRSAFLTLGAGYELGLTDSHISGRDDYYYNGRVYPFVSGVNNNVIAAHTMYDSVSFTRKALWVDFGFMFKF